MNLFVPTIPARADALVENAVYQDDGCDIAPKCLECPLPQCRYDLPQGAYTLKIERRIGEARDLLAAGRSVDEVAEELGVSRRTIFRYQAGA